MSKTPYLVGIVGSSASGKTSFLRDLLGQLPAKTCAVVSQDNYYRPIDEQQRDVNGFPNFDLPTAIHRDRFFDDMCRLVRGEAITKTEYTFNHRERQGALITIEPAEMLIMEGLFVFHYEEIRALLDLRVFIDAREELCKERRLERDVHERGYPPEHTAYQWEHHVIPAYRQFILPYREEAHFVVANHVDYAEGLEVVAHHVRAKLAEPRTK
jgi:uridine kinase